MLNFAPLREEQNSFAGETISDKVAAIFFVIFLKRLYNYSLSFTQRRIIITSD
jgi:hypothetical protein